MSVMTSRARRGISNHRVNNPEAGDLKRHHAQYDVTNVFLI